MPQQFLTFGREDPRDLWSVICPVCGCPWCHFANVLVDQGQRQTLVRRVKVADIHSDKPVNYRGSEVQIRMWCEEGHFFCLSLNFRKGVISALVAVSDELSINPDDPNEDPAQPREFEELWRD